MLVPKEHHLVDDIFLWFIYFFVCVAGTRREAEDRIVPRNIDADDSDVDVNDDEDSDR